VNRQNSFTVTKAFLGFYFVRGSFAANYLLTLLLAWNILHILCIQYDTLPYPFRQILHKIVKTGSFQQRSLSGNRHFSG